MPEQCIQCDVLQAWCNSAHPHGTQAKTLTARAGASTQNEVFYKNKEETVAGKLPRYVELLKFKTLSVGMKLWGAVAEVSARDVVISLPHGLKGFVAPAEASDALAAQLTELDSDDSDLSDDEDTPAKPGKRKPATSTAAASLADTFRVGQLVCCVVTALGKEAGGKKAARVDLSLRLSKLHAGMALSDLQPGTHVPAVVSSVEDHGLIVSFGIAGVSGTPAPPSAPRFSKGGRFGKCAHAGGLNDEQQTIALGSEQTMQRTSLSQLTFITDSSHLHARISTGGKSAFNLATRTESSTARVCVP